jgi:hypothetical protein
MCLQEPTTNHFNKLIINSSDLILNVHEPSSDTHHLYNTNNNLI